MQILVVNQAEVRQLLPMPECIDAMAEALTALSSGDAVLPLRSMMRLPDTPNAFLLMPAYLGNIARAGVKVIGLFPGNAGTEFDSHPGAVLLFDGELGQLLALIDASEVTAIRTAAVSGAATRALAREGAHDLAILGAGVQARTHLEAMLSVCQARRVRVFSPHGAQAFAERESQRHGIRVEVMPSAQAAVEGADIICACTTSPTPVLQGAWIMPGAHVNAVGAYTPTTRELDSAAVARSRLFVDRRESALAEAGDFLIPRGEGVISDAHILGELGDVLRGNVAGRTSPDDVTLFKSLGLAVEDVAAAHLIYTRALENHLGTWVEFGGSRH